MPFRTMDVFIPNRLTSTSRSPPLIVQFNPGPHPLEWGAKAEDAPVLVLAPADVSGPLQFPRLRQPRLNSFT